LAPGGGGGGGGPAPPQRPHPEEHRELSGIQVAGRGGATSGVDDARRRPRLRRRADRDSRAPGGALSVGTGACAWTGGRSLAIGWLSTGMPIKHLPPATQTGTKQLG